MSDEIKEIFIRMNDLIEHQFDKEYHTKCDLFKDIQGLLDYITNLQTIECEYSSLLSENAELQQENDRLNNIINELKDWLESQKLRNNEWNNFIMKDGMVGIPISYLLNKIKELESKGE